ncbi:hypothetical protein CPB84DRAFT_1765542 [Gymnopilus junonius]|uniref:Uncharacterized protein n=1 Tax=Gymnopilus junonius TaxID=109634 RepID=A0A9P5TTL6_GYMJU|nr:hypothetical protein CPB84DRAFT_1765542 [Gymnopilus junonius]
MFDEDLVYTQKYHDLRSTDLTPFIITVLDLDPLLIGRIIVELGHASRNTHGGSESNIQPCSVGATSSLIGVILKSALCNLLSAQSEVLEFA